MATPVASAHSTSSRLRARTLWTACTAHALHDGYADLIYLLLPLWQAQFGLGYGVLALLRGTTTATMAGLQVPAGRLAERIGGRITLAGGTALAALGYLLAGLSSGLAGLCGALIVIGCGLSTQHPIASAAVSRSYGANLRGPIGTYNFAGDVGKVSVPSAASLLLTVMPWHQLLWAISALGGIVAGLIAFLLPAIPAPQATVAEADGPPKAGRSGFILLLIMGILDTGTRTGFLTFLPFLLRAQGASLPMVGLALALVFSGGAAGKFACGWLGARAGALPTILVTEAATSIGILSVLILPLGPTLMVLVVLGVMLNGTSSVFCGSVPDLAPQGQMERAFARYYTATIGSGALAPVLYGVLGDAAGPRWATVATAVTAATIPPLALLLAPALSRAPRRPSP